MKIPLPKKMLPVAGGAALLILLLVLMKSCGSDDGIENAVLLEALPQTPSPDADTPADTIKTLTAAVSALLTDVEVLRKENETLRRDTKELAQQTTQVEHRVSSQVKREFTKFSNEEAALRNREHQRLEELLHRVDEDAHATENGGSDIPSGFGYDDLHIGRDNANASRKRQWIKPLRSTAVTNAAQPADPFSNPKPTSTPVYTIPRNATLLGSVNMTALIGRVPLQNQVVDPMPFKLVTGTENLAANGLRLRGIQGMIWSGTAVGDWGLSCVTGFLHSATFVFKDGMIRTVGAGQPSTDVASAIAWISDGVGLPCIPGERKTNVGAWLAANVVASASTAAATAAAAAETTQTTNSFGVSNSVVTGDLGQYILGKSLAGGSESIATWLQARAGQEFDAVFVPAGREIAVHITQEIHIDYTENGRKLTHEHQPQSNVALVMD